MTHDTGGHIPVFKSEAGARAFRETYDRLMDYWPVPYETMEIETEFGCCHVIASGPVQGEPVLLFHGMTGNSALWYPTVEALSGLRIFCVDNPGDFGKSKAIKRIGTPEDAVRWIHQLMGAMGLAKAIFIGHSMGGWLSANYAVAHPERILRLVLLAPVATFLPAPFGKLLVKVYPSLLFPKPRRIRRAWGWFCAKDYCLPSHVTDMIIAAYTHGRSQLPVVPRVIEKEMWKNLCSPVLFVVGDEEKIYDAEQVKQRVSDALPQSTICTVQQAGHCLILEQKAYVNKVVREFLLQDSVVNEPPSENEGALWYDLSNKSKTSTKEHDSMEATAQEVAEWMVKEIKFTGKLFQADAIEYVKTHFGEQFVFVNENGNASLSKEVKKAFRKLHGGKVAWERDSFFWAWT